VPDQVDVHIDFHVHIDLHVDDLDDYDSHDFDFDEHNFDVDDDAYVHTEWQQHPLHRGHSVL
jgi:hypothetical protein